MTELPIMAEIIAYNPAWEGDEQYALIAVRQHVGRGMWPRLASELKSRPCTVCFSECFEFFNIKDGRYIRDCYNHFHGKGEWEALHEACLTRHKKSAYDYGFVSAKEALAQPSGGVVEYDGHFLEDFKKGMEDAVAQHSMGKAN